MRTAVLLFVAIILNPQTARAAASTLDCRSVSTATSDGGDAGKQRTSKAIRAATGVRFSVIESYVRRNITSTNTRYGFKIRSVDPNSPAAAAGLRRGDVLLTWDGEPIKRLRELRKWIDEAPRDAAITVTFTRLREKRSTFSRDPWREHEAKVRLTD